MKAKEGHRYYEQRTRLEQVIPLKTPLILYVDPSSACNLQCSFCPCGSGHADLWTEEKRKSVGLMDFPLFKKIVDDCKEFDEKIKVLRLYKEGEPLLNPHFADMVAYGKESRCFDFVDTTTNGTKLNPKLNREIVAAGLDRINISVEALSDADYKRICNRRINFEKFVDNVRDLYENKGNCHVFVKTVTSATDAKLAQEQKAAFYEKFGDICDEIAFEHLSPCWPGFDKEYYSNNINVYGGQVQSCIVCPRIFYILTINSDGAASQCIVDWNRRMIIGDVHNSSVVELWKSMRNCQIEHLKGNRRKMVGCDMCLEIETAAIDNIDPYREELLKRMENV